MKLRTKQFIVIAVTMLLSALFSPNAMACATCFGKTDDPMAHGMNAGILTLLIVITLVILSFFVFMAYLLVRGSKYSGVMEKRAEEIRLEMLQTSPPAAGVQS